MMGVLVATVMFTTLRQLLSFYAVARLAGRLEEQRLRLGHLAHHDPLTGLANRTAFIDRATALVAAAAPDRQVAVLLLDLDGFKPVDDTYGHAVGDRLLVAMADRLPAACRPGDFAARLGGDEFVLVASGLGDAVEADLLADRIIEQVAVPVATGDIVLAHAGAARVAHNWALARVKAVMDQRAAERSYAPTGPRPGPARWSAWTSGSPILRCCPPVSWNSTRGTLRRRWSGSVRWAGRWHAKSARIGGPGRSRRNGGCLLLRGWAGFMPGWRTYAATAAPAHHPPGHQLWHRGGGRPQRDRHAGQPAAGPPHRRRRFRRDPPPARYKTVWNGGRLLVADRWYPSSKTCSVCGVVKTERTYHCTTGGLVLDRDVNAARNLAALAAEFDTAGSGPVAGRGAIRKTRLGGPEAVKRQPGAAVNAAGQAGTVALQGATAA